MSHKLEQEESAARTAMADVPHKILVMSGKGGVGKTTISVNIAYAFAAMGKSVGIVDADLHGPNVALMTGTEGYRVYGSDDGTLAPARARDGVRVLSIASFLPDTTVPVAWRGPRKSSLIRQFLGQGNWKGVDVLIVDCPPGTGDEPMTVAQLIPDSDGVVIVTSPQDVALLDSRKCVNFVRDMDQRVLGIVENLSGFVCPECGHRVDLFKTGGGERAAKEMDVPFLGRIPIAPAMVSAGDSGKPLVVDLPDNPASLMLTEIAANLERGWNEKTNR